ncbi:MAG: DNA polymerase III subunit alpha [Spirochaetes bacterium]|nr:DNA polymerase III subunit alpha [Spirochaetota bacterium]MBN2772470.1 DNA polymerase III subunit alpha [Spirochaetota bacterium]
MGFVHLHNHTDYSALDGAITVKKLIERTADYGMTAVAISDHGNMCGAIDFYETARKKGIKPIIAQEFYIAPDSRFNRKYSKGENTNYHLMLYAKNNTGYLNLLKLSSIGYLDGFYYKPRIDFEVLEQYKEGLICSTACLAGEIPQKILSKNMDAARETAKIYQKLFGEDHFYLEMQDHGLPEQQIVNEGLVQLSKELSLPLIATNDCHYTDKDDAYAHEVLLCIQTGKTMEDESRMRFGTNEFYFKKPEDMERLFSHYPDAIHNTQKIADMCDVELKLNNPVLPTFTVPDGFTLDSYMRELVYKGAAERYGKELSEKVKEQIEYELSVITNMGFSGYFLIVWDFINHARKKGIPVGPGRGSAAGSIVSYCMGITQLNPLDYNLLFERFLNPDRNEMPDMDIDFCGVRREEIIQYVRDKYGDDHVSQIMAFNTLKPKAAVKDVARALSVPFTEANRITKYINEKTIMESVEKSPELKEFYNSSANSRQVIDIAVKLEGLIRSFGKHAAGVVISKEEITHYVPLYKDSKDGSICAQFEKKNSEAAGLVKMDFLGLKNLTIINHALCLIKEHQGVDLDIETLPIDDPKVYKLLQNADTNGIFQLESSGMQNLLRKLGPTVFDDIIAVGALYRPGPLNSGMADQFIKRKRDPKLIEYPHECLEPVLKDTLGVIIYQEQVMKISQVMGGFSMSEADKLRKAMGKKLDHIVEQLRGKFLEGAEKQKIDPKIAETVYDAMAKFAEYGFNKSHAAAYGLVTYQTAYLKTHYRAEYMCALLTAAKDNQDDITKYIADCRTAGITVLPPDINQSDYSFTIEKDKIRYGFCAIKGLGERAIEEILKTRDKNGAFSSLQQLIENLDLSVINKGVLESLIKSGSLVSLNNNRAQLFAGIDTILETARFLQKDKKSGQGNLFGGDENDDSEEMINLPDLPDWQDHVTLNFEKETLGLYITGHPLARYEKELREYSSCSIINIEETSNGKSKTYSIVGILENVRTHITKKGATMAFAMLEDMEGSIEVVIFPRTYKKYQHMMSLSEPVMLTGEVEISEDEDSDYRSKKMLVSEIRTLAEVRNRSISAVHLNINTIGFDEMIMEKIRDLAQSNHGSCPLFFNIELENGQNALIRTHNCFNIEPTENVIHSLKSILGDESIHYAFKNVC